MNYTLVANWKMYLTVAESRNLAALLADWWAKEPCPQVDLVICPSMLAVHDVATRLSQSGIDLGVQEISTSEELGAFTGQTGARQAKEAGAAYALMGHSEMRQFYHVTDEIVAQQFVAAQAHGLKPIICVGETKDERASGRTDQVIMGQLHQIFGGKVSNGEPFYIAYEPRWAIGNGNPVDPAEAERVHGLIRHTMFEFMDDPDASVRILYGGSVDASNLKTFLQQPHIHGALIGSASTKVESLKAIVDVIQQHICL